MQKEVSMKTLNTMKVAMDIKAVQAKESLRKKMAKCDPGLNELLIEAGLIIVGVTLLVFFTTQTKPIMEDFLSNCKEKALAIFNM